MTLPSWMVVLEWLCKGRPPTHARRARSRENESNAAGKSEWSALLHCNSCNGSLHGKFSNLETMNGFMKGIQHKGHLANGIIVKLLREPGQLFQLLSDAHIHAICDTRFWLKPHQVTRFGCVIWFYGEARCFHSVSIVNPNDRWVNVCQALVAGVCSLIRVDVKFSICAEIWICN